MLQCSSYQLHKGRGQKTVINSFATSIFLYLTGSLTTESEYKIRRAWNDVDVHMQINWNDVRYDQLSCTSYTYLHVISNVTWSSRSSQYISNSSPDLASVLIHTYSNEDTGINCQGFSDNLPQHLFTPDPNMLCFPQRFFPTFRFSLMQVGEHHCRVDMSSVSISQKRF